MLVKVIGRALPNVGPVGTVRDVSPQEARVLLALGRVQAYVRPKAEKAADKPKRAYKRKDMVAEPVIAEPEIEEVEEAEEAEGDEE